MASAQSAVANGHWCGGKRPSCGASAASLSQPFKAVLRWRAASLRPGGHLFKVVEIALIIVASATAEIHYFRRVVYVGLQRHHYETLRLGHERQKDRRIAQSQQVVSQWLPAGIPGVSSAQLSAVISRYASVGLCFPSIISVQFISSFWQGNYRFSFKIIAISTIRIWGNVNLISVNDLVQCETNGQLFWQPYVGNRVWVIFIRENKFWKETFEIGSSICNINASIEYISSPMQVYNVVPVNFNIKNLKRYLMYFGVSTDSCISFPFIADCQTNSDLAASVVLTATYCITN